MRRYSTGSKSIKCAHWQPVAPLDPESRGRSLVVSVLEGGSSTPRDEGTRNGDKNIDYSHPAPRSKIVPKWMQLADAGWRQEYAVQRGFLAYPRFWVNASCCVTSDPCRSSAAIFLRLIEGSDGSRMPMSQRLHGLNTEFEASICLVEIDAVGVICRRPEGAMDRL